MNRMSASCVAEAVGTFFLCFIGAGVICMNTKLGAGGPGLLGIAIAHGLALSIGVSATMNVSGGHLNPAVTVAMLVTGRIKPGDAIGYIASQLIGGIVAGALLSIIFKDMMVDGVAVISRAGLGTPTYGADLTVARAILVEACLTFLLVTAVFGTAVDPRAPKIGGFGIGLTIAADILMGGPLTGAAMNPARTFGPGLVASFTGHLNVFWSQQLVYWVGPCAGAVLAAVVYDAFIREKK
ncbi:MAG: aquaporin [Phycisphaerae bacterium]